MVKVSGGVCIQRPTAKTDSEINGCKTNSNLQWLLRRDREGLLLCNLDQESGLAPHCMTKRDQFSCNIRRPWPQRSDVAHIMWLSWEREVLCLIDWEKYYSGRTWKLKEVEGGRYSWWWNNRNNTQFTVLDPFGTNPVILYLFYSCI